MPESVRSLRTPDALPSEVLFVRGVRRKATDQSVVIEPDASLRRPTSASTKGAGVASQWRSVASMLRQLASAYGLYPSGPIIPPRNALSSTFQKLRRTARAEKGVRIARRFANPAKLDQSVPRSVFAQADGQGASEFSFARLRAAKRIVKH